MNLRSLGRSLLVAASLVLASTPTLAGVSQQVPVGPRALAMGGAFSSIADDAEALYWNPAGLPWIGHQEIVGTHANLFGSDISDNYAAFALPLTHRDAAAVDWYHSGFQDTELDFGENRIDLSYGRKVLPFLSAGATVKYLTRNTDLDQVSVRRGTGAGLDFGILATPLDRLRCAVVAQDAFDTKLTYSSGDGTVVAYPRTVRVGASYSPIRDAIIAADLDDRLHVGAEFSPVSALALRAGIQNSNLDGLIWSAGTGIQWNIFRLDYAYVDHPTLGGTSHFGLGLAFNFNPSQIRIEKAEAHDIYTSLYKRYAHDPFGSIRVRSLDDKPLEAKVSVFVPRLMATPSYQDVVLRPRATKDVPLTALFSPEVLSQVGDHPAQVQVSATYQSLHLPRAEKASARFMAYGPGAIDWSQGVEQAAAFVTMRDSPVDSVAHEATRTVALMETGRFGIRNVDFAAALFDALGTLGIAYVPDPNNPYEKISGTPKAVDTVSYPRETLKRRTGDCDDTSVLMAALLENVGIQTEFVDVPGHLFVLANTGIHERNWLALGLDDSRYVVHEKELWIPIETTQLGKGFAAAWKEGMDEYASSSARAPVPLVDITDAQSRYEPAEPPGSAEVPSIDTKVLEARIRQDLQEVISWREAYLGNRYSETRKGIEASPAALNEVAHAYFLAGKMDDARLALEQAMAKEPASAGTLNNLANIDAAQGDFAKAVDHYAKALTVDRSDAGMWLNLGLAHYVVGDSAGAEEPLARGVELSGGYEAACALLGLKPEEPQMREGTTKALAEEARQLLKSALRKAPATKARGRVATEALESERTLTSGVFPGRGEELSDLLYWKR